MPSFYHEKPPYTWHDGLYIETMHWPHQFIHCWGFFIPIAIMFSYHTNYSHILKKKICVSFKNLLDWITCYLNELIIQVTDDVGHWHNFCIHWTRINTRSVARFLEISLAILTGVIRSPDVIWNHGWPDECGNKCVSLVNPVLVDGLVQFGSRISAGGVMT